MIPIGKSSHSRFCVWLTTEPSQKVPDILLHSMRIVAWDNVTDQLLQTEEASSSGQEVTSYNLLDDVLKTGKIFVFVL